MIKASPVIQSWFVLLLVGLAAAAVATIAVLTAPNPGF
jgi:hypothetical protein